MKRASIEIMDLMDHMFEMEGKHYRGRGFLPNMVSKELSDSSSYLRDTLRNFLQKIDNRSNAPIESNTEPTPDVNIALNILQEIYDAMDRGKPKDTADSLMEMPSTYYAVKTFLEPSLKIAKERANLIEEEERERRRKEAWNAMTPKQREEHEKQMMNMMELMFNFPLNNNKKGGNGNRKRKTRRQYPRKNNKTRRRQKIESL